MEASCWKDIKDFLIPFLWVVEGTEGGGVAMVDSLSPLAFSLFLNGGLHLCTHVGIYAFNGFIVMIIARSNRCSSRTLLWSSHSKCHFSRVFVVLFFVTKSLDFSATAHGATGRHPRSPLWLRDFSLIMMRLGWHWVLEDMNPAVHSIIILLLFIFYNYGLLCK